MFSKTFIVFLVRLSLNVSSGISIIRTQRIVSPRFVVVSLYATKHILIYYYHYYYYDTCELIYRLRYTIFNSMIIS